MTVTATFVRDLDGWAGDARFFALSEPVVYRTSFTRTEDGDELQTSHVIVCGCYTPDGPETYVFPADPDGEVLDYEEIRGSFKGAINHAQAIGLAGWRLACRDGESTPVDDDADGDASVDEIVHVTRQPDSRKVRERASSWTWVKSILTDGERDMKVTHEGERATRTPASEPGPYRLSGLPTIYDAARDRYLRDPQYHALVDSLRYQIESLNATPSEVREAAMLACIMFEERRARPMLHHPGVAY